MPSKLVVAIAGLCLTAAGAASAQPQVAAIGVAWDPAGTVCHRAQSPFTEGTFYILAFARGAMAGGITGAELRLEGFPQDWYAFSIIPSPHSILTIGNPLQGGCNIAFPSCQGMTDPVVLLYTVRYLATTLVNERILSITRHSTPSNPQMSCPVLVGCDAPCFFCCCVCASGVNAAINYPGYCPDPLAVESRAWAQVRSLYR